MTSAKRTFRPPITTKTINPFAWLANNIWPLARGILQHNRAEELPVRADPRNRSWTAILYRLRVCCLWCCQPHSVQYNRIHNQKKQGRRAQLKKREYRLYPIGETAPKQLPAREQKMK